MSDTTDVKLLTPNTKTVFNTSAAIERVKIHNNSSYFLRVYYGADAPTDPVSGAGWHETIDPGGTPLCEVVGNSAQTFANRSYIQSTPYQGVITVMPFLPVGATLAAGGIVGGAALAYLTAYYPGEWAQEGGEIEAYVQAAKQGRYQSVPGATNSFVGAPFYTDETTPTNTVMAGPMFQIDPVGAPNLFAANAAGQSQIVMYLWAYQCVMRARTPAVARVNAWVQSVITSNAFAVKGGSGLIPLTLSAVNFGTDRFLFVPAYPMQMRVILAQGALASGDLMGFRYQLDTNAGHTPIGSFELAHSFSFYFDIVNQSPDYALGIPNNFIVASAFPWNATYNPQTY